MMSLLSTSVHDFVNETEWDILQKSSSTVQKLHKELELILMTQTGMKQLVASSRRLLVATPQDVQCLFLLKNST